MKIYKVFEHTTDSDNKYFTSSELAKQYIIDKLQGEPNSRIIVGKNNDYLIEDNYKTVELYATIEEVDVIEKL